MSNALVRTFKGVLAAAGLEIRRFRPGRQGRTHSNFGEQDLLANWVSGMGTLPRFCVDIGAGDGEHHSNSLGLFKQGFSGVALEWDGETAARLAWRHRELPNVRWARAKVTPTNIVPLLKGMDTPSDFGVLSLDIDGYDYFVLKSVLEEFHPWILCVEINEKIPPPLRFSVLWDDAYLCKGDHFYGQSLSQAHALASSKGYALVALEYNNAFFIRRDKINGPELTVEQAYREGYLNRPDRLQRLPWNKNMEDLIGLDPEKAAALLQERFAAYAGKFLLEPR